MTVLELDGVWKSYPSWRIGQGSLRAIMSRRAPVLLRRGERRWVLEDISLEVGPGESLGVVGHNGAGKSTLLRLASGLSAPTRGRLIVSRETGSVLSLGSWFDMTLTGRENATTAAIVLGRRRAEARQLVSDAIEFAELEEFADAPVRIYSEGMKLRLAFGVLAQLEHELLIVDEALAVGDLAFQVKCLDRIREMRRAGTALVLASHDLGQVVAECDRAVWLDHGRVRKIGSAGSVVAAYREAGRLETLARTPDASEAQDGELTLNVNRWGSQDLQAQNVVIQGPTGLAATEVEAGASLSVSLDLVPQREAIEDVNILVSIFRVSDDVLCAECSSMGALRLRRVGERTRVTLDIERLDLAPQEYVLDVGVYPGDWSYAYDFHWHAYPLHVTGERGGEGLMQLPMRWSSETERALGDSRVVP